MKKAVVFMLMVFLLSQTVFAGGGGRQEQQRVVIRWGSVHAETTVTTQMMRRIIEEVNTRTEGRVVIQGHPNSALGGSRDLVEGVQAGMVEMITEGPAQFASWIPMASIAEAPYIYRDIAHMRSALSGAFGNRLNEEFLKSDVRMLGAFYYGTRQLSTTRSDIRSVRDMDGLKIRVPEVRAYMEMINSWGAAATPIPFGDLYLSLSTNVVDGQENPLTTFNGQNFFEIQRYIILTDHIICPNMIFINEDVWKRISPADQRIVQEAVTNGIAWNDAEVIREEEELLRSLAARGVTIVRPDVESFRAVTGPWLVSRMEADWGRGTWEMVQNIR